MWETIYIFHAPLALFSTMQSNFKPEEQDAILVKRIKMESFDQWNKSSRFLMYKNASKPFPGEKFQF